MEFSLIDKTLFITIFDIFKQFSDNIKLKLNSNTLHIQSVDDANVSIIDIKLSKTYFNTYKITKEIIYDFSITDICKILKICAKSRLMQFYFNDTILKIVATENENDIKKVFEINSIITKDDFIKIENLRSINLYDINMNSKHLYSIFSELFIFSDDVCINYELDKLDFYTNNDNINTKYTITTRDTSNTNDIILSKYSLNYLSKYKLISHFEETSMKIESNSPIILHNKNEHISCNFILSPKIIDI